MENHGNVFKKFKMEGGEMKQTTAKHIHSITLFLFWSSATLGITNIFMDFLLLPKLFIFICLGICSFTFGILRGVSLGKCLKD